jgi:hypothetical protein
MRINAYGTYTKDFILLLSSTYLGILSQWHHEDDTRQSDVAFCFMYVGSITQTMKVGVGCTDTRYYG